MTKNSKKMIELQEITLDKIKIFSEIQDILQLIKEYSINTNLQNETRKIENLLKVQNNLSIEQISSNLNIDKDIIKDILATNNNKKFKVDMKTGRWILNE